MPNSSRLLLLLLMLAAFQPEAGAQSPAPATPSLEAGVQTEYSVLNERAQLRWQRGEYDKALELLRQMAALKPDEPAPHYAIGQILGSDGALFDQAEALRALNTCLRLAGGETHKAMRSKAQAFVLDLEDGRKLNLGKPAAAPAKAQAGEVKSVLVAPGVFMELVYVPAGRFQMGSPAGEAGRKPAETPHEVQLTRGFWMGKTEVTQAQWKAIMGANPSQRQGDNLPVTRISWNEAQNFTRTLNARVPGGGFSLPTEAQWEYACRAGGTGPHAGSLDALAWYDRNSGQTPHAVAGKAPNGWGLHDMHGNVWEWCADWAGDYAPSRATDPVGPLAGAERIVRGGSYNCAPAECRSAHRNRVPATGKTETVGLRLVRRE